MATKEAGMSTEDLIRSLTETDPGFPALMDEARKELYTRCPELAGRHDPRVEAARTVAESSQAPADLS